MDFFGQAARARRQTRLLLWLFGLAVLIVVCLIYSVVGSAIYVFRHPMLHEAWWNPLAIFINLLFFIGEGLFHPVRTLQLIWHPHLAVWTTTATLVPIAGGCIYKWRLLSAGG